MKTPRIYIGALAVFCIAALVIGSAGAAAMTQQGTGNNLKVKAGLFGPEKMLDNLAAQGYDVAAIRAAVTSGDYETAHTLMQEFRTAHPDVFPHAVMEPEKAGYLAKRMENECSKCWITSLHRDMM